jgi:hypothetical protein
MSSECHVYAMLLRIENFLKLSWNLPLARPRTSSPGI